MCSNDDDYVYVNNEFANEDEKNISPGDVCRKCKVNEAKVILRQRDLYCYDCFVTYFVHKFRSTIGKSKMIKPNDKVLVACSEEESSLALIKLLYDGLLDKTNKKIQFKPYFLFIDEICVGSHENHKIIDYILDCGFSVYFVRLEDILASTFNCFEIKNKSDLNNAAKSSNSKLKEKFSNLVFKELKTDTSRDDFIGLVKTKLISTCAKKFGFQKIFLPTNGSQLAKVVLEKIVLGRGGQLLSYVNFRSQIFGLNFFRPMMEIFTEEIDCYLQSNPTNELRAGEGINKSTGVKTCTENFIEGLQKNFCSTVPTILKTGGKICSNDSHNRSNNLMESSNNLLDRANIVISNPNNLLDDSNNLIEGPNNLLSNSNNLQDSLNIHLRNSIPELPHKYKKSDRCSENIDESESGLDVIRPGFDVINCSFCGGVMEKWDPFNGNISHIEENLNDSQLIEKNGRNESVVIEENGQNNRHIFKETCQNDTETELDAKNESETKLDAKNESETKLDAKNESETKLDAKNESETKLDAKNESETKLDAKNESETKLDAKNESETKLDAKNESETKLDAKNDTETELDAKNESTTKSCANINSTASALESIHFSKNLPKRLGEISGINPQVHASENREWFDKIRKSLCYACLKIFDEIKNFESLLCFLEQNEVI